eukprot:TRINITY_DN6013_c0_g1_i2.p1 TRINITY_DN6013_c0_g1~~TRINITY_DN6013_c0_g1_i2.p1  ORF type:complete len:594 (-),score=94.64 TRINITY_DN6013_c0_g1_i2:271-2052(-)
MHGSKKLDFMSADPQPRIPFIAVTNITKLDSNFPDTSGLSEPQCADDTAAPPPPDDVMVAGYALANVRGLRWHAGDSLATPPRTPRTPLSPSGWSMKSGTHGRRNPHDKAETKKLVTAYEGSADNPVGATPSTTASASAGGKSMREKVLAGEDRAMLTPEDEDHGKVQSATLTKVAAAKDSYNRPGCRDLALRLLKWWPFDALVAFVVLLDFVVLGVTVQNSLHPSGSETMDFVIYFMDRACTVFYVVELALRFYGCGWRWCLSNGFIRLDCILVACAVSELLMTTILTSMAEGKDIIGKMSVLRILRVARIGRAARLTVHLRTLWLLISGLQHSATTIFWTFIMITGITYAFALLGMELIPPDDLDTSTVYNALAVDHFGDLMQSMLTLLQVLTMDSIAGIYRPLITEAEGNGFKLVLAVYFLLYILFVSIALMNLVTAVMVEGAMQQANEDKEFVAKMEVERRKRMLPELREMFATIDIDGSGQVTLEELIDAPEELKCRLKEITGSGSPVEIFQLIDEDESNSLAVDEFLDGLLKCANGAGIYQFQMERLIRQVGRLKQVCVDGLGWSTGGAVVPPADETCPTFPAVSET